MPRVAQAPPPGIVRSGTAEATAGRWYDSNNVRFHQGVIQPVGGNKQITNSATPTLPRDILTWHANDMTAWAAIGTDAKLWALNMTTFTIYDITPTSVGLRDLAPPGQSVGYGIGLYGKGVYGSGQAGPPNNGDIAVFHGDKWSMDTFGEDLLVLSTTSGILHVWKPTTPTVPAAVVAAAPTGNRGVIVTDQRQVVLLGASGDPRNIAWSDQEDYNSWTPAVTNLAGSKYLVTQAYVMTATKVPQGILIFTSNDVHLMQYVGPPYAYGITQVGADCGPISLRAPVSVGPTVIWPGKQSFWTWAGTVSPIPCDVGQWFFNNVNQTYVGRVFGSANQQFNEMWWDWPDTSNTECNRYLAVNYTGASVNQLGAVVANRSWIIGQRRRTAGVPIGTMDTPIMGGPSAPGSAGGALYIHEFGWDDDGAPRASAGLVYLQSGAITLGEGDQRMNVVQLVYDATADPNTGADMLGYQFTAREQPYDSASETTTPLYTGIHGGLLDVRFSGRTVQMRMQAVRDGMFSVGRPRLDMKPAGTR